MSALWILIPIAIVIIAIVIVFPRWFSHRRMRDDHDLASAEQFLEQIGKSHDDAALGWPAPAKRKTEVPARQAARRGRHRAPEASSADGSPADGSPAEGRAAGGWPVEAPEPRPAGRRGRS